jgi:hypothetical protein
MHNLNISFKTQNIQKNKKFKTTLKNPKLVKNFKITKKWKKQLKKLKNPLKIIFFSFF